MNQASSYTSYSYDNIQRLASLGQQFAAGSGNVTQTFGYVAAVESQVAGEVVVSIVP
jgi:hypothetical protein